MKLIDKYNRIHNYLRLSVTGRCNLNCVYCNPTSGTMFYEHNENTLSNLEILRLVMLFLKYFEFNKIRLTGGEPFARKDIIDLIGYLSKLKNEFPFELSATTNGTLLNGNLEKLNKLGLDRLNFSLDSLKPERFNEITGKNQLHKVLNAIDDAENCGFEKIKINTVIIRNLNDDEIQDFIEYSITTGRNVRFIEYMPFSNNGYDRESFLSSLELFNIISKNYKLIQSNSKENLVAKDFRVNNTNALISFISPISDHFCGLCNRLRITSEGKLKLCLFSAHKSEIDLLNLIRNDYSDKQITESISNSLLEKEYLHPEIDELIKLKNNNIISLGG
ncbi:MAG: GTP 3',8-cyclase MoaA [Ignavibacteriae bacterium]|nr:GTP 3',8-cyclase MoaA [Ignavibacteriota bacterium]